MDLDAYYARLEQARTTPFPPECAADIDAYRHQEMIDGYRSWKAGDPPPGDNHSTSFRWGWQNAQRDRQKEDDGYDCIRRAYISAYRDES